MELDRIIAPPSTINHSKDRIVRQHGISATAGLLNFLCGMIGPGCFSVAMSFQQAGLWGGFVMVFAVGVLSTMSMYKIIRCSQHLTKIIGDQSLDYGEMADEACKHSFSMLRDKGPLAKWVVNGCLVGFQLGAISICLVFTADHILEIHHYWFQSTFVLTKTQVLLIYFVPQLGLSMFGDIRNITYLSLAGNFVIFSAAALVTKTLFEEPWYNSNELPATTTLSSMTMAAGALVYALEGQALVLPLENKLKRPEDMLSLNGVLVTAMNLITLIYAFLGFFGYLTYGDGVLGSLTLNLPNNSLLSTIVKTLLVAKIFIGNALQLFVIVEMLRPTLVPSKGSMKVVGEYMLRTGLMFISLIIAISVPDLYDIIPFVGSTTGMMLCLIMPAVLDSFVLLPTLFTTDEKPTHKTVCRFSRSRVVWEVCVNCVLFSLGSFIMISGLYSSITNITNK